MKVKNLRDAMTNLELALTNLGEAAATELHQKLDSKEFDEFIDDMAYAGNVIKVARNKIEEKTKISTISKANYLDLTNKEDNMIE